MNKLFTIKGDKAGKKWNTGCILFLQEISKEETGVMMVNNEKFVLRESMESVLSKLSNDEFIIKFIKNEREPVSFGW